MLNYKKYIPKYFDLFYNYTWGIVMKKSLKVLVILFFIAIVVGSVITVYLNNLKEKKKIKLC